MRLIGAGVNRLPRFLREQVYIWSGWSEALAPKKLSTARTAQVAEWMANLYPRRKFPAVAIGSSNGGATHLFAALGIPWLPQTFLMPVARSGPKPDDPRADFEWAREPARIFLENNPEVQLHHMHDPNQDRLMIQRMTYFRLKRLRLGAAYENFLRRALDRGGTILLVECGLQWPTTRCGERHLFQFGALGGATIEEYHQGGPRVADYLARYHSPIRVWDPPQPNEQSPEAEWGFEPALREDAERLAEKHGWRVRRIVFEQPEDLSPLVTDFYRWWNRETRELPDNRLVVDSFILMEPYWTIATGSTPFWMVFNKEPSARALGDYLDRAEQPFDEIFMMLFSHGVNSVGLVPIDKWRELLGRAWTKSGFLGVDESAYPRDFAVFARYHSEFRRKIKARHPLPAPAGLDLFEDFLTRHAGEYRVRWIE